MTTQETATRIWNAVRMAALLAPDRLNSESQISKLASEIDAEISSGVKRELANMPKFECLREKCERLEVALEIAHGNLRAERLRVKSFVNKIEHAEKREQRRVRYAEEALAKERVKAEQPAILRSGE